MARNTPHRSRGRPVGIKNGESLWQNYMYPDETKIYENSVSAIEKAKADMREPLSIIAAIRTRCCNRIYRERKRGEQE